MKKLITMLFIILCFGLVACGGSEADETEVYDEEYTTPYTPEETSPEEIEIVDPENTGTFEDEEIGQNSPLIGTWHRTDAPEQTFVFNADGTATQGTQDNLENFTWWQANNYRILRLRAPGLPAGHEPDHSIMLSWNADGSIVFEENGQVHIYMPVELLEPYTQPETQPYVTTPPPATTQTDSPILGTWEWEDHFAYTYTFNADGTGQRGSVIFGGYEYFTWQLTNDNSQLDFTISNPLEGILAEQSWQITWLTNNRVIFDSLMEGITDRHTYLRAIN